MFSVANASVNMGKKISFKTRALDKNEDMYFVGCPCHVTHTAEQRGGHSFTEMSNFDVDELVIDIFYWFDKRTKRMNELNDFASYVISNIFS